ncbi:hypothetical protein [Flavobacterium sp. RSSB_23]
MASNIRGIPLLTSDILTRMASKFALMFVKLVQFVFSILLKWRNKMLL